MNDTDFCNAWDMMECKVHSIAAEKGWWDEERNNGELVALIHSEVSEMLEALREEDKKDEHLPLLDSIAVEMADVVIRLMDMANARGYDLSGAICKKVEFNAGRPRKHGKLF